MIGKVLDILFGKAPDIFDTKGNVLHKFPPEKWQAWRQRFEQSDYNWRKHKGTERIASASPKTKPHSPKV